MESLKKIGAPRLLYIDFLRILSIILVLFLHTYTNGFSLFTVRRDSAFFLVYLLCSVFAKIAVPIYFMISGALLLHKEERLSDVLTKRFCKYVVVLFFASLANYLLFPQNNGVSVGDFLEKVYSSNITTSLWFLYAYLGFILMLPLLRKMAKLLEKKDYIWLTGIVLLFSVLRITQFLLFKDSVRFNSSFAVAFTGTAIYYPLMGDFLANKVQVKNVSGKIIMLFCGLAIMSICIAGWLTCEWCNHLGEWKESTCQKFINELIYIPACTVFFVTRYLFTKKTVAKWLEKTIIILGSATFGVYLFEKFYRSITKVVFTILDCYLPTLLACFIWVICAFLVGSFVTLILKKIPLIKNYL